MVVLNDTCFSILHVLSGEITNYTDLDKLPMVLHNELGLVVIKHEKSK